MELREVIGYIEFAFLQWMILEPVEVKAPNEQPSSAEKRHNPQPSYSTEASEGATMLHPPQADSNLQKEPSRSGGPSQQ